MSFRLSRILTALLVSAFATAAQTYISATPDPIIVTDGSGLGVTTMSYSAPGAGAVSVYAGSTLFCQNGSSSGSCETGQWVSNGAQFFLKDASGNVLAQTTVAVQASSATLSANPNPIYVTDGSGLGTTTLSYNAPSSGTVALYVGGTLFCENGTNSGSCQTGQWVTDGMEFELKDTAGNTLATFWVSVVNEGTGSGCSGG